jgi:hemoglobin/transferrin/lactoferrin receptor protein
MVAILQPLWITPLSRAQTNATEPADAAQAGSDQAASTTDQPTRQTDTLPEVIVTAERAPEQQFRTPYNDTIVDQQQIFRKSYRTTPQALRDIPGVMVQETAHGHGSPYIRGFTSFRTLMLIDGVRLNNSVFRPGPNQYWNTVDPLSLERLEVVKGPSSVLYGSDAIGGTVNAITKDPYSYGDGVNVNGRGYYRVSNAENSHIARGELSLGIEDHTGLLVGGSGKHFGDLIGGDTVGKQTNIGYDEYDVDIKAERYLSDQAKLVMAHQRVRQNNVPRTHKTRFSKANQIGWEGLTLNDELQRELDQERELTYLQLHADEGEGGLQRFRGSVSYQRQSETRDRIQNDGSQDFQGFDVNTFGLWMNATSETAIGTLTFGFDFYHDNVNSFKSGDPIQGPVADDATYDLLGVFIQDKFELLDDVEVTLGGRMTYAAVDANSVNIDDNRASINEDYFDVTGSARAAWFFDEQDHWNLFGGVSQGFRAPNLSDLTRDTDFGGGTEIPAPGLDPEHYVQTEIGIKAKYDNLSLQSSYYYTFVRDQILRVPGGGGGSVFPKQNSGDGFVTGIEFGAAYDITPAWTVFGNAAWLDGEVDVLQGGQTVSDTISRRMPLMGQLGLRWEEPANRFWAETVVRAAAKQDDLSLRDQADTSRIPPGGTPGYAVWNLRGGYDINENLRATVAVENVLDEDYRVHGSGQNRPGRNLIFSVDARF